MASAAVPGISETEAQKLLQTQDRILARFPEVSQVFGKAGRAETSTDPAPLSMAETIVTLKPVAEWRRVDTWYTAWAPKWIRPWFQHITPDHISQEDLVAEMNRARFTSYNVIGALIWVIGLTLAGYLFGNLPLVQQHLSKIIWALILVPGLIAIFGAWKARRAAA